MRATTHAGTHAQSSMATAVAQPGDGQCGMPRTWKSRLPRGHAPLGDPAGSGHDSSRGGTFRRTAFAPSGAGSSGGRRSSRLRNWRGDHAGDDPDGVGDMRRRTHGLVPAPPPFQRLIAIRHATDDFRQVVACVRRADAYACRAEDFRVQARLLAGFGQPLRERVDIIVSSRLTVQVVPSGLSYRGLQSAFTIATVDGSEVAYVDTALRGLITSSREDITRLTDVWESIRTCALSQRESVELIRRTAEERWT
jgi:hypothetical protein